MDFVSIMINLLLLINNFPDLINVQKSMNTTILVVRRNNNIFTNPNCSVADPCPNDF